MFHVSGSLLMHEWKHKSVTRIMEYMCMSIEDYKQMSKTCTADIAGTSPRAAKQISRGQRGCHTRMTQGSSTPTIVCSSFLTPESDMPTRLALENVNDRSSIHLLASDDIIDQPKASDPSKHHWRPIEVCSGNRVHARHCRIHEEVGAIDDSGPIKWQSIAPERPWCTR